MNKPLQSFLLDLKTHDPLPSGPPFYRQSIATNRLVESFLWLGYQTLSFFRPTFRQEDEFLCCVRGALRGAAISVAVLCLAYGLDLTSLPLRMKRTQAPAIEREARLKQLQDDLFEQCWSHSHAFTAEQLSDSWAVRSHEVGLQIGCSWHVLMELAAWCGVELSALLVPSSQPSAAKEATKR